MLERAVLLDHLNEMVCFSFEQSQPWLYLLTESFFEAGQPSQQDTFCCNAPEEFSIGHH